MFFVMAHKFAGNEPLHTSVFGDRQLFFQPKAYLVVLFAHHEEYLEAVKIMEKLHTSLSKKSTEKIMVENEDAYYGVSVLRQQQGGKRLYLHVPHVGRTGVQLEFKKGDVIRFIGAYQTPEEARQACLGELPATVRSMVMGALKMNMPRQPTKDDFVKELRPLVPS